LPISKRSNVLVGEKVYAIGSPQGLDASLSEGIISGRRETEEGIPWIQTTASISPGSSGGPLLDVRGEVVGVMTAIRRGGQNLNRAVSASQILQIIENRSPKFREVWRGVGIQQQLQAEIHGFFLKVMRTKGKGPDSKPTEAAERVLFDGLSKANSADDLRELVRTASNEFGEYEYLFHAHVGVAAVEKAFAQHKTRPDAEKPESVQELRGWFRDNTNHKLALDSFKRSIELKSDFAPAYLSLADCLAREGRWEEALSIADQLVGIVPRCAQAYTLRGDFKTELDRNLEAYADFETAAELSPNDPETHWEIGQVCLHIGENVKAIAAYETAIHLKAKISNGCYANMGLAYERMGRFEQALHCYEQAKSLGFWPSYCDEKITACRARLK
jgi:tetratricopeptide (TPR) repeat protein